MKSQKINLKNRRDQNIVGVISQPDGKIIGTAVLQHGHGQNRKVNEMEVLKEVLLKNQIQTFIFDTSNSGNDSDGIYEDSRVGLHADDFEDISNWVQKQDWFLKPFIVVGKSLGGYSAIRYAENFPKKVDFVIAVAPFISGEFKRETLSTKFIEKWKKDGVYERESRTQVKTKRILPFDFFMESLEHDLLLKSYNLSMPILLIAGENDKVILPKHIEKLFQKIPHENKTYKLLPYRGHDFRKKGIDKKEDIKILIKTINTWLKERLDV